MSEGDLLSGGQEEIARMSQRAIRLDMELAEALRVLAELQNKLKEREAQLAAARLAASNATAELNRIQRERDAILGSTSWRITSPLRVLKRGLQGRRQGRPATLDAGATEVTRPRASAAGSAPAYAQRLKREEDAFNEQINVHDLPQIFHYWSNKHLGPIFAEAGISTMPNFFAEQLAESARRCGTSAARFLSIGSGNCDLELQIATALREKGLRDFTIECLELNQVMLDRGAAMAREQGLVQQLVFTRADFNIWTAQRRYDGIMANQSLHHVMDLEHLLSQVASALDEKGMFVVSDIIGCNGHQRWPEALQRVHELWRELPDSYHYNHALSRHEPVYENWDCSTEGFEGIRAQDVLPMLIDRFEFEMFVAFGNVIDIFVDRAFGHNFDPDREFDRQFVDRVHEMDERGFQSGELTPTHLIGTLTRMSARAPFFSRGLMPAACVRQIDRTATLPEITI